MTVIFERIDNKNINESQNLYMDIENENGTMMDYFDYYNETESDEIDSQTFFVVKNFTKRIEEVVYNQEIEEANMEIYEEELQAEEIDERIEEVNLVKVRHLDEVFTLSKVELNKLCEIEEIEPQNKNKDMEEIELKDAIEKAKDEINKCLKINDDCIVKKYKNKKENLEMNGVELGLYEVDRNKNNVASEFLFNENLIMEGDSELYNQLLEATRNGAVFRKLFQRNKNHFTKTSGFISREVRYARAIYCIKKLTLNMLKIYQSEPKTREASINYTIAGVWIRNDPKIKESMKNVTRSKNMLIKDKSLNSTFREDIFNGILNVAKLESLNGEKGSSSMAIFGYIVFDKFKNQKEFNRCSEDNKCIIYFYIKGIN
uniref:Uncharacterized protein n=1 Tax=Meloidogyne enterolobii TaxID=390850 RepID=A0A6V7X686_MELEN|nr:unnamed protein product [Meloidogyne enterolobii]